MDIRSEPPRVPLVVVAGLHDEHVAAVAEAAAASDPLGTAVVHHDLREVTGGVVRRHLRHGDSERLTVLELAHGCVSCTLREDFLPLLRGLAAAPDVRRIVVRLDPSLEPEAICWAIEHVVVDSAPVARDVEVAAVLAAVDLPSWLADASGDEPLHERGLAGSPDDERTVAQVGVGQVEFADAVVLAGATDRWQALRTEAVVHRLTPSAPLAGLDRLDLPALLDRVPAHARRGEVDGAHGPLLRGQPPLEEEAGASVLLFEERRPFHPERLHDALDVLLDGVVRTRGRAWVASQPETALWLESAGGGLRVGHAGPWLVSQPPERWAEVDPERQVKASLNWDAYYGDRMQELVVIAHEADPREVREALLGALLTDAELALGEAAWREFPDPFGEWHEDPCAEDEPEQAPASRERGGNQ
ncbi:ribosome hibernation factor-recruiting GTPase MRF [Saccharopolyspora sp. MS10]|uniref:ribosome hibernation factor-recruiting GTPase MRF n=1 Tax=Saccharopolyspora sp. MS10 TaxID=3385973 RepID=UPI0039A0CAFA